MVVHFAMVWYKLEHRVIADGIDVPWAHSLFNGKPSRFDTERDAKHYLAHSPLYGKDGVEYRIVRVLEEVIF